MCWVNQYNVFVFDVIYGEDALIIFFLICFDDL